MMQGVMDNCRVYGPIASCVSFFDSACDGARTFTHENAVDPSGCCLTATQQRHWLLELEG